MWRIVETRQLDDGTWEITLGRQRLDDGTVGETMVSTFAEDHPAAGDDQKMAAEVAEGQESFQHWND